LYTKRSSLDLYIQTYRELTPHFTKLSAFFARDVSRIYLGPEGSRWREWTPQELRLGAGVVYR
jgi:hypothetical protein